MRVKNDSNKIGYHLWIAPYIKVETWQHMYSIAHNEIREHIINWSVIGNSCDKKKIVCTKKMEPFVFLKKWRTYYSLRNIQMELVIHTKTKNHTSSMQNSTRNKSQKVDFRLGWSPMCKLPWKSIHEYADLSSKFATLETP